ncbi:MAG: signal peptidase II [Candidatus Omnitrophota bacterium]|mgnify:CR=1 FL=1|nr:MAG: signal peptidase II [Candidatus Omnitrophota bacterium]
MIFIIIFIVLFLDQLTKLIATNNLILNKSFPVIKGIFHFTLVYNRGAAFGLLKGQIPLFVFTSIFAIILVLLAIRDYKEKKISLQVFALSLILAGGLGNLIDRIFLGYVVDFLDFRIWPVFNIADSAITIGAVLLGWTILKGMK